HRTGVHWPGSGMACARGGQTKAWSAPMIFTYRSTIVIAGLILAACGGSDSDSVAPVGGGGSPEGSWVATPQAGTGGALSPATPQSVPNGDTTSFTVTTSPGYRLQDVSG